MRFGFGKPATNRSLRELPEELGVFFQNMISSYAGLFIGRVANIHWIALKQYLKFMKQFPLFRERESFDLLDDFGDGHTAAVYTGVTDRANSAQNNWKKIAAYVEASATPARFFCSNSLHQPLISVSLKILPMTRRRRPLRFAFSTSRRERMASSL